MKAVMRKVNITPTTDVFLEGYGGRDETCLAINPTGFTSEMMARILILNDGKETTVYLNLEMVITGFGYNISVTLRGDIAEACNTTIDNILLSNTHDHQAMWTLDAEQELKIFTAIKEAYAELVEVNIGVDTYGTKFGTSRSPAYGVDEEGVYDNTMTVVRFDNAETGEEMGLIYSAPIHNTALGVNCVANWKLLSCELCGYASRYIEEKYSRSSDFTAMFIDGFYGNSGPYFEFKEAGTRHYAMTPEELKGYGERLGDEILDCYEKVAVQQTSDWKISVKGDFKTLKRAPLTEDLKKYWGESDVFPLIISSASFGEVAFMGVNYEPFSIIGAKLRSESPYEYLIPAGNVGGWNGYIPIKETFNNGRFEHECQPWKTALTENSAEEFRELLLDSLCKMKGVTLERVMPKQSDKCEKDGKWVYTFEFAKEIAPDKIAISFGQRSRMECGAEFKVECFADNGENSKIIDVKGNAVNCVGFTMKKEKVAKVKVTVERSYRSEVPIDSPVTLHAVLFSEIK